MTMLGHVTSSYWSEALGRSTAMAVVADGRDREGETLHIPMPDRTLTARASRARSSTTRERPAQRLRWRANERHDAPFAAEATITELPPATRVSIRLADPEAAAVLGRPPARIGARASPGGGAPSASARTNG